MTAQDRDAPGFAHFVWIRRPNHKHMRYGAQSGKMLDRLMCWSILAKTDRVVSENVDHLDFRKRSKTNRRAHVI